MSHLSLLQQHVAFSGRILSILSQEGLLPTHDATPDPSGPAPPLPAQDTSASDLRSRLHLRCLGKSLVESICSLYESRCRSWWNDVQREWIRSYTLLASLGRKAPSLDLLRKTYITNFTRGARSIQSDILFLIDGRIESFHADSEAAASASSSDGGSDTDDDNVRGHGAAAVAILEAAYAYTTNITQAEKRRLAQATGLEPRQVVIWFQNRRNRKVKSRIEAAAPALGRLQASPQAEPARKRKVFRNDAAGPRRPSTFVTPEKKARLHGGATPPAGRRLLSSASSSGSSIDSRADSLFSDWATSKGYGKQRTVSSESAASSFTSPSVCSSFTSTPASEDCDTAIDLGAQQASQLAGFSRERLAPSRFEQEQALARHLLSPSDAYAHRQPPPVDLAHIFNEGQQYFSSSGVSGTSDSNLLFSEDSESPRLDFDDLGLSLADFEKGASTPFDFIAPPPTGGVQLWQRGAPVDHSASDPFATSSVSAAKHVPANSASMHNQSAPRPHHFTDVAEVLNDGDFDLFAALASLPTFQGMSPEAIVQFAASGGQDLSFKAEQGWVSGSPSNVGSSTSSSTPQEKEIVTPPSKVSGVTSPDDFAFTFDFAELGLHRSFEEIRQSYRIAEEEAKLYSISDMEDGESGGMMSGWETGPEETRGEQVKRLSSSTIVPEPPTPSGISNSPWAIPSRPVDLHAQRGTRQAGGRFFGS